MYFTRDAQTTDGDELLGLGTILVFLSCQSFSSCQAKESINSGPALTARRQCRIDSCRLFRLVVDQCQGDRQTNQCQAAPRMSEILFQLLQPLSFPHLSLSSFNGSSSLSPFSSVYIYPSARPPSSINESSGTQHPNLLPPRSIYLKRDPIRVCSPGLL